MVRPSVGFALKILTIVCLLAIILVPEPARGQHWLYSRRQKRVSDQRLAELETLLALSKLRGKLVTVPVAFGRLDPAKLGRRRRSVDANFEDDQGMMQAVSQNADAAAVEGKERLSFPWKGSRRQLVGNYQLM